MYLPSCLILSYIVFILLNNTCLQIFSFACFKRAFWQISNQLQNNKRRHFQTWYTDNVPSFISYCIIYCIHIVEQKIFSFAVCIWSKRQISNQQQQNRGIFKCDMMMTLFSRTAIKGSSSFWYLLTHGERFQPTRVLIKHWTLFA